VRRAIGYAALAIVAWMPGASAADAPAKPASADPGETSAGASPDSGESARRAEGRYQEMLSKMQTSVEEIAQLYGNPVFLQVFTNDEERANELKRRLRAAQSGEEVRREVAELEKKRDELLSDIALKKRESSRLAEKLVRQRAALDALASAVEEARRAVEDTAK